MSVAAAVESSGYNVNQALSQQVMGTPMIGLMLYNGDNDQYTFYNIIRLSFSGGNSGGFSYERTEARPENNMMFWLGS